MAIDTREPAPDDQTFGQDNVTPQLRVRWRVAALVWLIPTLLGAMTSYTFTKLTGSPIALWKALAFSIPTWYFWAFATPVIFRLGRIAPIGWPIRLRALSVHIVAGVTAAFADVVCGTTVALLLGAQALGPRVGQQYLFNFMSWLLTGTLTYWVVLGAGYALDFSRKFQIQQLRSSELSAQLARSELAALRAQLHPHFLFNTLNTAVSLVRTARSESAVLVLTRLSDILRRLLHNATAHEITLREEISFLASYVEIEKARFPDRLHVTVQADASVLDSLVPNLLLQPLVENAIRYGIGRRRTAGHIDVRAHRSGDRLTLQVQDDGPGLPSERPAGATGVGLANTRARLQQLYGTQHEFMLGNTSTGGAEVTIVLPFRPSLVLGPDTDDAEDEAFNVTAIPGLVADA
ncbi:MAG TPA: histidine kinase [Gemmatimonadaceae bacterium]